MGRSHPTYKCSTMKHNNMIAQEHFKKYWQRYVKTWFDQPAKKKARRLARQKKAAAVAPRPVAGSLRSLVHPPTQRYNSKVRIGRGFSLAEIKAAGLGKLEARSLGIAVDPRRRNRSVNGKQANEQRLREYKANLVVFPRNAKKTKAPVKAAVAGEFRKISKEEASANVTRSLKAAWNDARLVGYRAKRAQEKAEKAAQDALKKSK